MENFEEAISAFQKFLKGQGELTELVWVFREDAIGTRDYVYLRWPLPAENEKRVRAAYRIAKERGFGVSLNAFGVMDRRMCCYIYVPEDDQDASYRMISGLKLSVLTAPIPLRRQPILSWNRWLLRKRVRQKTRALEIGYEKFVKDLSKKESYG